MSVEEVVLLDGAGRAVGSAPKGEVHHAQTPLHLAFSAYLFRPTGELLLTRRALSKRTFPGVWTNSVCGHPAPGEPLRTAVRRRAATELGLSVGRLQLVLPDFGYRAEMGGVVEHELCPVFVGRLGEQEPTLEPAEVAVLSWVGWESFSTAVLRGEREVSPWCREQVAALRAHGADPTQWPDGDPARLPPAARLGA